MARAQGCILKWQLTQSLLLKEVQDSEKKVIREFSHCQENVNNVFKKYIKEKNALFQVARNTLQAL